MKKTLFMAVLLTIATAVNAQETEYRTATLIHGDQTKVFYGVTALTDAYNAAADTLDVIILSPGTFSSPTEIRKSISIYGSGMEEDATTGQLATTIGSINIKTYEHSVTNEYGIEEKTTKIASGIHIEGVNLTDFYIHATEAVNAHDITVKKCQNTKSFIVDYTRNVNIEQSVLMDFRANGNVQNMNITNCWVSSTTISEVHAGSTIYFDHCIVAAIVRGLPAYFSNSIIYREVPDGSTCYNNLFLPKTMGSDKVDGANNWFNIAENDIWANEETTSKYDPTKDYALKFPELYVGTDGTEIGLHGGYHPWNKKSALPRILESSIDTSTATDGKLKVSIKAEAQIAD